MTERMSLEEFKEKTSNGQIFSVDFIKRGDGSLRTMSARRGVKKGVKGVGLAYKPEDHNLLIVYDMQALDPKAPHNTGKSEEDLERGAFRNINLEGLVGLRMDGKTWHWNNAARRFEAK